MIAAKQPLPFAAADVTKAWVSATHRIGRQIARARISPCGKRFAAAGLDAMVHVIEGDVQRTLSGHETWIAALAFAPDGRLFSADLHGDVLCWDAALENPLWSSKTPGTAFLRAMALSPDGKTLATVGDDRLVRLREVESGKITRELKGHESYVYAVAFHPDGSFVTGDLQGRILHWEGGALKRELDAKLFHARGEDWLADVGGVRSFAFSPDGRTLAAGGMKDIKSNTFCPGTPVVALFDWAGGRRTAILECGGTVDGPVNAVAYLPDGTLCGVSESHGGNAGVFFWRGAGPKPLHTASAPSAYDLDVHPDGLRLAIAAYASNGKGGNGRPAKTREEYVPNAGELRVYSLFEKPKPEPKKK